MKLTGETLEQSSGARASHSACSFIRVVPFLHRGMGGQCRRFRGAVISFTPSADSEAGAVYAADFFCARAGRQHSLGTSCKTRRCADASNSGYLSLCPRVQGCEALPSVARSSPRAFFHQRARIEFRCGSRSNLSLAGDCGVKMA